MSRLESAIRRLEAQRDCINFAASDIAGKPGLVLELGLGNGRTYDHLRATNPGREIYVFDRRVAAHPNCLPDAPHLILGDVLNTLPRAAFRLGRSVMLAHCDIGTGDEQRNRRVADLIAPLLARMMLRGGLVLSDQPMHYPAWTELAPPGDVAPGRYRLYRT